MVRTIQAYSDNIRTIDIKVYFHRWPQTEPNWATEGHKTAWGVKLRIRVRSTDDDNPPTLSPHPLPPRVGQYYDIIIYRDIKVSR